MKLTFINFLVFVGIFVILISAVRPETSTQDYNDNELYRSWVRSALNDYNKSQIRRMMFCTITDVEKLSRQNILKYTIKFVGTQECRLTLRLYCRYNIEVEIHQRKNRKPIVKKLEVKEVNQNKIKCSA